MGILGVLTPQKGLIQVRDKILKFKGKLLDAGKSTDYSIELIQNE